MSGSDGGSIVIEREPEYLGPYELVKKVGGGGFAETFLARAYGPEGFVKDVCIKRVPPEHVGDPDYEVPLRDEAVMMAALSHPHIAAVYDFCKIAGLHVMVLEYVDGTKLGKLIQQAARAKKPFPRAVALYVASKMLDALDHAHRLVLHGEEQHLIHRDINPNNVLIDRKGFPKLIDFGLVKARSRVYRTQKDQVRGTLAYMARETIMASSDGAPEDARVDIYAVGILLHELLAGANPMRKPGGNDAQTFGQILKGPDLRVLDSTPDLPPSLAELIDRMTSHDREKRPATALEALELLTPFLVSNELTVRRQLADMVLEVTGQQPGPAIGHERPRDVDTATRVRERHADSGIQAKPSIMQGGNDVLEAPTKVTSTETMPAALKTSRRLPARKLVAASIIVVAMIAAAFLSQRGGPPAKSVAQDDHAANESRSEDGPPAPARRKPIAMATTQGGTRSSVPMTGVPHAEASSQATPSPAPTNPATTGPSKAQTEQARSSTPKSADGVEKNSWLDISVKPNDRTWQVWVDGEYFGTADVKVKVSPGKHLVEVGVDRPSVQRSVRVSARGTRAVPFEL